MDQVDGFNPYEAPKTLSISPSADEDGPVPRWVRFFEWVIDDVLLSIVTFAIFFFGNRLSGDADSGFRNLGWETWLYGNTLRLVYYFLFESFTQQTIGKILLGLEVVTRAGGRPGMLRILARSLARLIPFESLFIFGPRRECLHDKLSRTCVVELQ